MSSQLSRRHFLTYFSSLGLSSTLLPGVLWAKLQDEEEPKITKEMLEDAEAVAGLEFSDEERELMLRRLNSNLEDYEALEETAYLFKPESITGIYRWQHPENHDTYLRVAYCGHTVAHAHDAKLDQQAPQHAGFSYRALRRG